MIRLRCNTSVILTDFLTAENRVNIALALILIIDRCHREAVTGFRELPGSSPMISPLGVGFERKLLIGSSDTWLRNTLSGGIE